MSYHSGVQLTVVRVQGLRLIVPNKSWRPIVTIDVDRHQAHEVTLGVDGQNVDLSKRGLHCSEVAPNSTVEIKVWNSTQNKKRGKKRQLVASASHTLGDLCQRVKATKSARSKVQYLSEVRLTCHSLTKRNNTPSSKGRPQNGATLTLKVDAEELNGARVTIKEPSEVSLEESVPSTPSSSRPSSVLDSEEDYSSTFVATPTPPAPQLPQSPYGTIRRRRKRSKKHLSGYIVFGGDLEADISYSSCDESTASAISHSMEGHVVNVQGGKLELVFEDSIRAVPLDDCYDGYSDAGVETGALPALEDSVVTLVSNPVSRWLVSSLLPQHVYEFPKPELPPYSEPLPVRHPGELNWWERFVSAFTNYLDLRNATMDSEFEAIFHRIRMEWTFVGTLLAGLAAVNTAVLSISPDSSIPLSPLALRAIASSSIFTGLGITATAYFIFRYSFSSLQVVRSRALDVYSSYVFFSISARVPTLCMVASAISLMLFLGIVAFELWPTGVVVVSFVFGVVMSLQFLIFGCHQLGKSVLGGGRRVARAGRGLARKMTGSDPQIDGVQPVTRVTRKVVGG